MVELKSNPPCLFPKTQADRQRLADESFESLMSEIARQLSILEAKNGQEPGCKAFIELCRQNDLGAYRDGLREIQELIDGSDPPPIVADLFWSQGFPGCYLVRPDYLIWKIPALSDSGIYIDQDFVKEQIKLRISDKTSTSDIWGDKEVVDWSSDPESAILVVSGTSQSVERLEKFSVEGVDHLASKNYTTLHLLNPLPDEVYERSTIRGSDAIRQLAIQSLRQKGYCPEASYTNLVLAEVMRHFKGTSIEEWFDCLARVLTHHSRVAIVIDVGVLRDNFRDADQWAAGFSKVIKGLEGKALVKVMIIDGRSINFHVDPAVRIMTVDGA